MEDVLIPKIGTILELDDDYDVPVDIYQYDVDRLKKIDSYKEKQGQEHIDFKEGTKIKIKGIDVTASSQKRDTVNIQFEGIPGREIDLHKKKLRFDIPLYFINEMEYDTIGGKVPSSASDEYNYFTTKETRRGGREVVDALFETYDEAEERVSESKKPSRIREINGFPPKKQESVTSNKHDLVLDVEDTLYKVGARVNFKRRKSYLDHSQSYTRTNLPISFRFLEEKADSLYVLRDKARKSKPFVTFRVGTRWYLRAHPMLECLEGDEKKFERRKDAVQKAEERIKSNWKEYENALDNSGRYKSDVF